MVVEQKAEGTAPIGMAEGRRVERPGRLSGQVAWPCSSKLARVHEIGPQVRLAARPNFDGHRPERTFRYRQAMAKNGPGEKLVGNILFPCITINRDFSRTKAVSS